MARLLPQPGITLAPASTIAVQSPEGEAVVSSTIIERVALKLAKGRSSAVEGHHGAATTFSIQACTTDDDH